MKNMYFYPCSVFICVISHLVLLLQFLLVGWSAHHSNPSVTALPTSAPRGLHPSLDHRLQVSQDNIFTSEGGGRREAVSQARRQPH